MTESLPIYTHVSESLTHGPPFVRLSDMDATSIVAQALASRGYQSSEALDSLQLVELLLDIERETGLDLNGRRLKARTSPWRIWRGCLRVRSEREPRLLPPPTRHRVRSPGVQREDVS